MKFIQPAIYMFSVHYHNNNKNSLTSLCDSSLNCWTTKHVLRSTLIFSFLSLIHRFYKQVSWWKHSVRTIVLQRGCIFFLSPLINWGWFTISTAFQIWWRTFFNNVKFICLSCDCRYATNCDGMVKYKLVGDLFLKFVCFSCDCIGGIHMVLVQHTWWSVIQKNLTRI